MGLARGLPGIGYDEREIVVTALSDKRGPASEAQQLYYETEASIERRRAAAQMRKAAGIQPQRKPDKKQRRQIHRFKRIFDEN